MEAYQSLCLLAEPYGITLLFILFQDRIQSFHIHTIQSHDSFDWHASVSNKTQRINNYAKFYQS